MSELTPVAVRAPLEASTPEVVPPTDLSPVGIVVPAVEPVVPPCTGVVAFYSGLNFFLLFINNMLL